MIFCVAGVTRIVKAARDRLPDRVAIGVLTRTFPPELVDAVIDEAKAREQRKRSLPARLSTYFVLAMWLWREHGYEEVLRQLIDGLGWSGAGDAHAFISQAGWIAMQDCEDQQTPCRQVRAAFDEDGITVYQAFPFRIARQAMTRVDLCDHLSSTACHGLSLRFCG